MMDTKQLVDHGRHCVCRLLAAAVGLPPGAVNYRFCSHVLQKRWVVDCGHGEFNKPAVRDTNGKWHDREPMDRAMKAVLIHEE